MCGCLAFKDGLGRCGVASNFSVLIQQGLLGYPTSILNACNLISFPSNFLIMFFNLHFWSLPLEWQSFQWNWWVRGGNQGWRPTVGQLCPRWGNVFHICLFPLSSVACRAQEVNPYASSIFNFRIFFYQFNTRDKDCLLGGWMNPN